MFCVRACVCACVCFFVFFFFFLCAYAADRHQMMGMSDRGPLCPLDSRTKVVLVRAIIARYPVCHPLEDTARCHTAAIRCCDVVNESSVTFGFTDGVTYEYTSVPVSMIRIPLMYLRTFLFSSGSDRVMLSSFAANASRRSLDACISSQSQATTSWSDLPVLHRTGTALTTQSVALI